MPGLFENFPLRPSVAREILLPLFQEQSLWKKQALDARVEQIHRQEGGVPGQQPVANVVKKALQDLQTEGLIINRYGHWQRIAVLDSDHDVPIAMEEPQSDDIEDSQDLELLAEKEIGVGVESVYLFFNPNDRKLAELEGRSIWECKIGKTSVADSLARVFTLRTALSHQPIVGLIIKTDDSSALEKALHASLRLVEASVPDSPGVEWFMTSPRHVEDWFTCYQQSLAALRSPSIADS